jgi:ferredoxin
MSYVFKQPATPEELKQCREALDHCPLEAIREKWDTRDNDRNN